MPLFLFLWKNLGWGDLWRIALFFTYSASPICIFDLFCKSYLWNELNLLYRDYVRKATKSSHSGLTLPLWTGPCMSHKHGGLANPDPICPYVASS